MINLVIHLKSESIYSNTILLHVTTCLGRDGPNLNIPPNIQLTLLSFPYVTLPCLGRIGDGADLATAIIP